MVLPKTAMVRPETNGGRHARFDDETSGSLLPLSAPATLSGVALGFGSASRTDRPASNAVGHSPRSMAPRHWTGAAVTSGKAYILAKPLLVRSQFQNWYLSILTALIYLYMDEIQKITEKYDAAYIRDGLCSLDAINKFALAFYKDVAEIYDCLTRIRNVERNSTGFSLDDAPILGLLVRVWKLLKEIIHYYEQNNAEIISILERPLIEASVVATFLMTSDQSVIDDYRKCSYKDRLRILRDLESGSVFFETKAGKRLLKAVREKMAFENLTTEDFKLQKKNRWKIQGKTFYDIFSEVEHADLYAATYGMMSESIHGSWNESMDWCLSKNDDGTFSTYPFYQPADIRYVTPTLNFTNKPFRLWLQRIDAYDEDISNLLDWVERMNATLYVHFDEKYDG